MSTVPAWEDPRRVLARHGLAPKRRLSQSFLVARSAVDRIAEAVSPDAGETVVELGPGLGTLTGALLRAGARVIAIERDDDMITVLQAELGGVSQLEVRSGDAAELELGEIAAAVGGPVAVAGNLPYAVTGSILRRLTSADARKHVSRAVLMVQREVRDRLVGRPGTRAWGALSVFVQAAYAVEPCFAVSAGSFHPKPRVESAVVKLVPREAPLAEETPAFQKTVRAVFDARRKTLRKALVVAGVEASRVDGALAASGIEPELRGETLTVEQLATLAPKLFR